MSIVQELETVIQIEHDALLEGDFETLEKLLPRKEALTTKLAEFKPDLPTQTYQELKDKALRNADLLQSVQRGLQAALLQVKLATDGVEQTTYSSTGEKLSLAKRRSSIAQKL